MALFWFIRIAFQHHINQPDKDHKGAAKAADAKHDNTVISG